MRYFIGLAAIVAMLFLSATVPHAEQIRLADGRYLQGEVVEVREDGFVFRRTDTGGRVFLRWGQVDEALQKRLTNQRDPDENLDLQVMVEGARLELLDGTEYEGEITLVGSAYRVVNRDYPRGRNIPLADVAEDGFIQDIMIDAVVMMTEAEVLEFARQRREPIEAAHQVYELARIADMLGLYPEAKSLVVEALGMSPDSQLEARLSEYDSQLDELIRQQGVLEALTEARRLARRRQYTTALQTLESARAEFNPTEGVLARWESTNLEIEFDFTRFVINEWHKQVRIVTRNKTRESGLTVSEAMNWVRRDLDTEAANRLAETVGGADAADIRRRFAIRHDLEAAGLIRLSVHRASFGQDGFYQIVGGHLPVAGRQPQAPQQDPRDRERRDRNRPRNRNVEPISEAEMRDMLERIRETVDSVERQEQRQPPDAAELEELLERLRERQGGGNRGGDAPAGGQDVSHLRVPPVVPSLNDWWERAGAARRANWLMAFYATSVGTVQLVDRNDWNVRYK
jgi:tetratricopeptide (TPR) repeat protein